MEHERIICFVDGFNMYHALKELRKPHLKWLDLRLLFSHLTRRKSQIITQIFFFSAYLTWKEKEARLYPDRGINILLISFTML